MAYTIQLVCIVSTCSITFTILLRSSSAHQLAKHHLLWFLSKDTVFPEKDSTFSVVFQILHTINLSEDFIMNFLYLIYTTVFFCIICGLEISADLESRRVVPRRRSHQHLRIILKCMDKLNRVYGSAWNISVITDTLNLSLVLIPRFTETVYVVANILFVGIKLTRYILAGVFSNKVKAAMITFYY